MTDPNQQCPGDWILRNHSTEPRVCGSLGHPIRQGGFSAFYSSYGISYTHVCGRLIGYQINAPDAFHTGASSIDSFYVTGVSLTHGPPGRRQHIWSFTAAVRERNTGTLGCPCANRSSAVRQIPSFVGNDFFCESGNPAESGYGGFYADDPLWDGQGCASPPCCELSYPPGVTAPWFCKQLPQTTTDDIEARICRNSWNEDLPVELIELYIH